MFEINDLHSSINGKNILKGLDLKVGPGEIHAIMGPNGSGKSTLAKVIMGHSNYEVMNGSMSFEGENLLELEPWERVHRGIFVGYQYPVEVPGVTNLGLLRESFASLCESQDTEVPSKDEFVEMITPYLQQLKIDPGFLNRFVNDGFSGGEKKKNEILQMMILKPKLAILDETDSGLDIDSLKVVANGINLFKNQGNSLILITHYQRLLEYIKPDHVHVFQGGSIRLSGDYRLGQKLEENGYDWVEESS